MGNALHLASFLGHENTVQLLIERGADVNSVDGCFETPLLAAIAGNRREAVEILLSNGADVNYCSVEHGSALHIGRGVASREVVELLMQHGAC
ncbi:hypothetical protein ASPWEDRAFT_163980 [Aspergillus wentii DTO 134E9]|uniref:Uncharacterized protein n=1 Tax=Aspergillus wentii DTO 134E9 TaxID=1073089 RepID=A0A1L9R5C0_ASPWE|nr:uncharacterized protein ASPWEDRAFT_163980 [Aspergillus wentii DTO 134E9]OJJ30088.1 hypothetical protein ASPWEDRAFT_163980 [Aspergillus wentii DTO 134E9]